MSTHTCHAEGCQATRRPEILMCFSHWRLVPREIQQAVMAAYKPDQDAGGTPSVAWCHAADAAIEGVAKKEKREVATTLTAKFHPKSRTKRPRELAIDQRTRAVNIRTDKYDVFIGRPGKDLDGPFGNPFRAGPALTRFREYFLERVASDPDYRAQVLALRGKRLGCFCKPKPCHGDIMAEWIDAQPE